jgi:hypothetical protein
LYSSCRLTIAQKHGARSGDADRNPCSTSYLAILITLRVSWQCGCRSEVSIKHGRRPRTTDQLSKPLIMLAKAVVALLAALPLTGVWAGQVPRVNGVIGGVKDGATRKVASKLAENPTKLATTPGKLRVVENSGVCGQYFRLIFGLIQTHTSFQRRPLASTRHLGMATSRRARACCAFHPRVLW